MPDTSISFKQWLLENGYDENGEYPSQNMYSSSEWDELYEMYEFTLRS